MHRVYLDSNATTPLLPEVFEAMRPYYLEEFGNASSIHHHGQHARAAVERARESVANLLGCRAAEVVSLGRGKERCSGVRRGPVERCGIGGDALRADSIPQRVTMHVVREMQRTIGAIDADRKSVV